MKTILLYTTLLLIFAPHTIRAQLIESAGKHPFPEESVVIEIAGTSTDELNFTMKFELPSFKGQTGTGKGSPIKVAPNKWAAQFVAPNQLWIFDGLGHVTLYERTIEPSGFKGSGSKVVPELLTKAPKELQAIISNITKAEPRPPKK